MCEIHRGRCQVVAGLSMVDHVDQQLGAVEAVDSC